MYPHKKKRCKVYTIVLTYCNFFFTIKSRTCARESRYPKSGLHEPVEVLTGLKKRMHQSPNLEKHIVHFQRFASMLYTEVGVMQYS